MVTGRLIGTCHHQTLCQRIRPNLHGNHWKRGDIKHKKGRL